MALVPEHPKPGTSTPVNMWVNQYQGARVKTATGSLKTALNALYEGYHSAEKTGNGRGFLSVTNYDRYARSSLWQRDGRQ